MKSVRGIDNKESTNTLPKNPSLNRKMGIWGWPDEQLKRFTNSQAVLGHVLSLLDLAERNEGITTTPTQSTL
jgi:hypothetical protein